MSEAPKLILRVAEVCLDLIMAAYFFPFSREGSKWSRVHSDLGNFLDFVIFECYYICGHILARRFLGVIVIPMQRFV